MTCKYCGSSQTICIYDYSEVRFQCINGHIWHEQYKEDGGAFDKPEEITYSFEDTLFPCEKDIYAQIMDVFQKQKRHGFSGEVLNDIRGVLNRSGLDEETAEKLYKKIVHYNPNKCIEGGKE